MKSMTGLVRRSNGSTRLLPWLIAAMLVGCGTPRPGEAPASASTSATSAEGEIVGTPRPGGPFAALKIGMQMQQVQEALGRTPDRWHTYESGKRWIPFYFGNDARRMQVLYNGEGCLIFADGNIWGGAGGDLIRIEHDASGACYQP